MPISAAFNGQVAGLAVLGGLMLGASASLFLLLQGRITGMSGILAQLLVGASDARWRAGYMSGLLLVGVIAQAVAFEPVFGTVLPFESSLLALLIAGVLVGFGTQLGNGCTSGHGLCGLPRLSLRSLLNTCAFFGVGALVSSLVRLPLPVSLFGFDSAVTPSMQPDPSASSSLYVAGAVSWYANQQAFLPWLVLGVSMALLLLAVFMPASSEQSPATAATASTVLKIEAADAAALSPVAELKQEVQADSSSTAPGAASVSVADVSASSSSSEASSDFISTTTREVLVSFCSALIFGTGLCFAGMTDPHRVASFLDFNPAHGWNPQLMLVLGAGVAFNLVAFRFILARPAPVLCSAFSVPNRTDITARLLIGGSCFGVGWGMCGICPGPGMVAIGSGRVGFPIFMCACIVGMYAYVLMEKVLAMNA